MNKSFFKNTYQKLHRALLHIFTYILEKGIKIGISHDIFFRYPGGIRSQVLNAPQAKTIPLDQTARPHGNLLFVFK
jgi:hypothetical protein